MEQLACCAVHPPALETELPVAIVTGAGPQRRPDWSADAASLLTAMARDTPGLSTITAHGRGMLDADVREGDVVLVQRDVEPRSGELAAVRVEGEPGLVLRRLYFDEGLIWLQTQDGGARPRPLDRSAVHIRGRVIAVARRRTPTTEA